LVKFQK